MKTYKSMKIKKVTAWPLDKESNNSDRDFFITISNGFKMPEVKDGFIIPNIRNAAKGIMSRDGLSYTYKPGDITCFQVKYQLDSRSGVRTLTFVTNKKEK